MTRQFAIVAAGALLLASLQADAQTTWFKYEHNPVFIPGAPGSWEAYDVGQVSIILVQDTLKMFYTGETGPDINPKIGYAWSTDGGITWTKYPGNPILAPSQAWEGSWVYSPYVMFDGSEYKMWYSGSYNQTIRIGYASSSDGLHWTKCAANPVLGAGPSGWDGMSVLFPAVVGESPWMRMYYSGASTGWSSCQIGVAQAGWETNDSTWTKDNVTPVLTVGPAGSWDAALVRLPRIIIDRGQWHMWYTGGPGIFAQQQIGHATSSDGYHWIKAAENPVLRPGPSSWDAGRIFGCEVLFDGSLYHMWYGGGAQNSLDGMCYAVSPKGFRMRLEPRDSLARAFSDSAGSAFMALGDTLQIRVHVDTPTPKLGFDAIILEGTGVIDTLRLFDDGAHGDSLAGDGLFANSWRAKQYGVFTVNLGLRLNDTLHFGTSTAQFTVDVDPSSPDPGKLLPQTFALEQNYPNPFNPVTRIKYTVGVSGGKGQGPSVKLTVYDVLGREVAVLVDGKKAPGNYEVTFDGSGFASGVYFSRMESGTFIQTRKLMLLR